MKKRAIPVVSLVVMISVLFLVVLHEPVGANSILPSDQGHEKTPAAEAISEELPQGIDRDWYSQVIENIKKDEYSITYQEERCVYQSPNRENNLRFTYHKDGFTVQPARTKIPLFDVSDTTIQEEDKTYQQLEDWNVKLTVGSLSKGEEKLSFEGDELQVQENTAFIEDQNLRLEYLNNEEGMRQNFIVKEKPEGQENLRLELLIDTGLNVMTGGDGILFNSINGEGKMRYNSLRVWDNKGKNLSAYFEPSSQLQHGRRHRAAIVVDDEDAEYPVTIDPLSTTAEWTAESNQADAYFGCSVATAGDVNGDGYSDVIVAADHYDDGQTDEGKVWVFHGSASGLSTSSSWSNESNQVDAYYGASVATAGDVNGDGYSDVIIGAYGFDGGHTDEGRASVYHGSASGLSSPSANWLAEGSQTGAYFGYSVSTAGDVNGDGYSDVIVGAYDYDNGHDNEGRAFVYLGSSSGLISSPGWSAESNNTDAHFGNSVSTAGDVNGDGYSDVMVAAFGFTNGNAAEGKVWVFHGSASGLSPTSNWSHESGQSGAYFGNSVSTAGDVNGDGYSDVIIGSYSYDSGEADEGKVFVYHGSAGGLSASSDWYAELDQAYAYMGSSVSTAGDVNGDGYADVIVGARNYDNTEINEGGAFVYFGSSIGLSPTADWSVESDQANANFGTVVAGAGDVNGDGYADVIVGAENFDNGQSDEGRAFVFHGSAGGLPASSNWSAGINQEWAELGVSVATAGDVNGDGYSDVIIGAWRYDNGGDYDEGKAWVYHGAENGLETSISWYTEGNQSEAYLGYSVATAGDVNGDGYSDVIVGAYQFINSPGMGKAWVFHGSASGLSTLSDWSVADHTPNYSSKLGYSVSTAGDVNGDGYSDVIVGAPEHFSGRRGRALVYHGSESGLATTEDWEFGSSQNEARIGASVSTAGDVNGDGYSDVIIGAYQYDSGETDEGKVWVFHGSASGLSSFDWSAESDQAEAQFGISVATAGDVNGDGYSDVIIGAKLYDQEQQDQGKAWVYHGSPIGLETSEAWSANTYHTNSHYGASVSTAGDINGDGYSDIIVGAPGYWSSSGDIDEGRAFVYYGSATGIPSSSAVWAKESNQPDAYFGASVSTAGDVNGDGFSDIIVGSPGYDDGDDTDEGKAFVFYGNGGAGLSPTPQQRRADDTEPLSQGAFLDAEELRLQMLARSPFGRDKVKLQWEIKPYGTAFDGSGLQESASWTDTGTAGVLINELTSVSQGLEGYRWRARALFHPAASPQQQHGRWLTAFQSELPDFRVDGAAISVDDVSATEGSPLSFTVSLSEAVGHTITVDFNTADGTATAPGDYAAASGTLTFAPGETSKVVPVTTVDDAVYEGSETFTINLSNPAGATISDQTGVGTILDNDPMPTLSMSDDSDTEGAGQSFTVSLSGASASTITVDYATADGTAEAPDDYAAASGTLTFTPGQTSKVVPVTTVDDAVYEGDETFTISLSNPAGATISDGQGLGTILDNDPMPTLSISDDSDTEGAGQSFTVSLSGASSDTVTVDYATADGTAEAPDDYAAASGTLTFTPGQTEKTVPVTTVDDGVYEGDETFTINLSNPTGATISDGEGLGTIIDDEDPVTISVGDDSETEGSALSFTVSLSGASASTITVDYATADGSANAPDDYAAASGTLTFTPGQTEKTVPITTVDDGVYEGDETFTVNLSNPTGAAISDGEGLGTILDNEESVTISVGDSSVIEGDSGESPEMSYEVTLSSASQTTVTVDWASADGAATAGADYTAGSGVLSFSPGDISESAVITVLGDEIDEIDETVLVNLSNASGATIDDGEGSGLIVDDDPMPSLSASDHQSCEGTTVVVPLRLDAVSGFEVSVDYQTVNGTATAGTDFVGTSGTLILPAGAQQGTILVELIDDGDVEGDESFGLDLSNPDNCVLLTTTVTITICDDESGTCIFADGFESGDFLGWSGNSP